MTAVDVSTRPFRKNLVIVFSKEPEIGKVKTRLIPALGESKAYDLYVKLFERTLNNGIEFIKSQPDQNVDLQIFLAGEMSENYVSQLQRSYNVLVQQQEGQDLGESMANALDISLDDYQKVLIIGGDCVSVDSQYLSEAFDKLDQHSCVVGPAEDGGFVLIGMTKSVDLDNGNKQYQSLLNPVASALLFLNIQWGESDVLKTLLSNAKTLAINLGILATRWDVDEVEDLQKLTSYPEFKHILQAKV